MIIVSELAIENIFNVINNHDISVPRYIKRIMLTSFLSISSYFEDYI